MSKRTLLPGNQAYKRKCQFPPKPPEKKGAIKNPLQAPRSGDDRQQQHRQEETTDQEQPRRIW